MNKETRLRKLEIASSDHNRASPFMNWFLAVADSVYSDDDAKRKALADPPEPTNEGERQFVKQRNTIYGKPAAA